jgi:glutathione S-transferase
MQVVQPWVLLLDGTRTREEMSELVKQMLAAVVTLEGALAKGRPFFGGDSVGYVDVALGGLLVWVRATEALFGSLGVNIKFLDAARTPSWRPGPSASPSLTRPRWPCQTTAG